MTDVTLRAVSPDSSRSHVVVDMTPLEGNGQNGGAGLVAKSLVRHIAALAPSFKVTLLTAQTSHAELSALDAPNVRRQCVVTRPMSRSVARAVGDRLLPPAARARVKRGYWSLSGARRFASTTDKLQPDLLFCPFTVPYFWRPSVPCVSIVYDLQHVTYPEFFTPEQRLNRQRHVEDACRRSEHVVCISEYVRGTLLAGVDIAPERVSTIPLGLLHDAASADWAAIGRLGLNDADFLLYPANFWPHKNHPVLFEALAAYRDDHPKSHLRLVCTGAPNALMSSLRSTAEALLPSGSVVFAGYIPAQELSALLSACRAVVFPSLYEGFGMPVLEALACGKPVLCSNVTGLTEVAGDAAIYFDPTHPREIAEAIAALHSQDRVVDLVKRGRERAKRFGDGQRMATDYLSLFQSVLIASA
jgi:glycosyltransferase involved in cell wall biosynthesis